jgi:hypothetical protein
MDYLELVEKKVIEDSQVRMVHQDNQDILEPKEKKE